MSTDSRVLTSAVMLLIVAGMTGMAFTFPPQAQLMPLLVGTPACVMALVQLIRDLRPAAPGSEGSPADREERRREAKMFLWLAVFFTAVITFGFIWATPVLIFAFLRFGERESWHVAIIGAIGAWLILYGVFVQLLELFLFESLLGLG
jgi:hypothetical protein